MGNKYWPQHGTPNDRQKLAPLPQSLAAEALAPRPNTQVSQPFKHDVDAEVPLDRPVSPSQDLKERTIYAVREVTRVLNRQQSPPQSRRGGRLLKGRLKPLHTFKLAGPPIDNCKGIQPEEGDNGPSDSRMLQRKRELLSMLPPDIFKPRPMTGESVHRTSIVSQLSTDREKDLEHEISKAEGETEDPVSKLIQVLSGTHMPPNSLASISDGNVSYFQDALTSHIDIPDSADAKDVACEPQDDQDENSEEDRSRVPQISEAYATSYESVSKIDLTSQQMEDVSAAGDAPTIQEKVPDEKAEEGSVKDEVKATMSDYMNEGGAARVLSDMVQRVTNSAKNSTVEDDAVVDQKYDVYFADTETRSDTPTSRTESSTLMRRRSSMDDMEMDLASCELTDMVSEDGLGEDGSLKQGGKELNVERGSLSSLIKAKATNEEIKTANDDTEYQSRDDAVTPTNEDFQKGPSSNRNLSDISSVGKLSQDNPSKVEDITASTLYKYIDSGLVEHSTYGSRVAKHHGLTSAENNTAEQGPVLNRNGVCEDDANEIRTESVNGNGKEHSAEQKPTEIETGVSSGDTELDVKVLAMGTDIQDQINDYAGKAAERHEEPIERTSSTPVSKEELEAAIPDEVGVETLTTVQIEITGPTSDISSEGVPDLLVEQNSDTSQTADSVMNENQQRSDENKIATVADNAAQSKQIIDTDECNGERTDLTEENEKLSKEDEGNEDAQVDENGNCRSNSFRKDDKDHDGSQGGGSHGNNDGSANGDGGGSNTSGEGGNENMQNDPPSETGSTGTQQRLYEIVSADNCSEVDCLNVQKEVQAKLNGVQAKLVVDSEEYDDIPDIDEAVLFCGICGMDEDMCLCPHSTFNEKLNSKGHRPTTKSASAAEDKKCACLDTSKRTFSAVEGLHSSQRYERAFQSWNHEAQIEEESIQRHLILEYQAMIEKPRQKGFLSSELTSPRFGQGDFMIIQGTGVKRDLRPVSAKRRPQSFSSEFEFRDHRTERLGDGLKSCDYDGVGDPTNQLECSMTSGDSMSEMQGGATGQSEELFQEHVTLSTGKHSKDPDTVETVNLHQSSPDTESLEVVAKPLSKPRHAKVSSFPAAAVPAPLCFKINAKPPQGFLYYFAYGADMNKNRMTSYIGREADHRLWGILFGFQLIFNKRGADLEAGGFPNIAFSPDSSVEGCVYLITPLELQKLDRHIGCPKFYTKAMFPVWMMNCAEPDELGVAQYCIPALMYVAQDEWTLNQEEKQLIESHYSVGQCLKGSDLLTPSYVQHISTLRVH